MNNNEYEKLKKWWDERPDEELLDMTLYRNKKSGKYWIKSIAQNPRTSHDFDHTGCWKEIEITDAEYMRIVKFFNKKLEVKVKITKKMQKEIDELKQTDMVKDLAKLFAEHNAQGGVSDSE